VGVQPSAAATQLWASEWRAIAGAQGLLDAPRIRSLHAQAAHGDHRAQMILGVAYDEGNWVRRDPKLAMRYYREAAKGGYVPGETALGESYYEGTLVPRDLVKADRWLQAATNAGDHRAWLDYWQVRTERDARSNPQALPADESQLGRRMADYFLQKLQPANASSTGGP
jgi:TPR repeat protein